jgi:hypothetical protein
MSRISLAGLTTIACLAAGSALAAPVQWSVGSGGNGHWYELIDVQFAAFGDAVAAAAAQSFGGSTGYLATVTSGAEQAFLNAAVNPLFQTAWLGGSDAAVEGNWEWVTGPGAPLAFGYSNWASFEPNNLGGFENGLLGWWSGDNWNDIYDGYSSYAYVVEYEPSPVPLPASVLMLGLGLGGLGLMARRRAQKSA